MVGVKEGSKKRNIKVVPSDFYRKTNTVILLFLLILIIFLINFSKILEVWGEEEIERAYLTGNVAGSVNITIIADPSLASSAAAEETTTSTTTPTADGNVLTSGGKLRFDPGRFDLDMFYRGVVERNLTIKNNANYELELSFGTSLRDYVAVDPSTIVIPEDGSGVVTVRLNGKDLGVITGYLSASGGGLKGYVPIVLNVGSASATGQLEVSIPIEFREVNSGDDILISVDLSKFSGDVVEIVYIIKDSENNELMRSTQSMTVRDSASFDKTLTMPNVGDGLYVIGVEVRYAGMTLVDSEVLTVGHYEPFVEKPAVVNGLGLNPLTFKIILLLVMIMIIVLFAAYSREIGKIGEIERKS